MGIIIKAHYDGQNIIPDEPLDLPVNQPLELELRKLSPYDQSDEYREKMKALERILIRAGHGINLPLDATRRESIYGDTHEDSD